MRTTICDGCRFGTRGALFCGKGLEVVDSECSGYLEGKQAKPYSTNSVPLGQAVLHDPFLEHYMQWSSGINLLPWAIPSNKLGDSALLQFDIDYSDGTQLNMKEVRPGKVRGLLKTSTYEVRITPPPEVDSNDNKQ